jgi:leucyl aminopeptidase (aminopeptidase T)
MRVMSELNRLTKPPPAIGFVPALSCTAFAAKAVEVREARREEEAKARAAQRKRQEEARRQRLASVMERADAIWAGLDPLMDQKVTAAYDQVAAQLKELRDAHEQAGESARFQQKLTAFRDRYARRPAMMCRIEKL